VRGRDDRVTSFEEHMMENGTAPIRIAVAEDEPDVRKTFVRLLEHLGHRVVCSVGNGEDLINQCHSSEVDIAFVDLDMPIVDGLAAAEIVSEKGIPVILVSGHPDARQVVVEKEPVVARLVKPASIDDLQRAIKKALATRNGKS
jgi:two-component system, response regulator PdtaR